MPGWVWAVAGVVLCLSASAFFALAEAALFSLSRSRSGPTPGVAAGAGPLVGRLLAVPLDLLATIVLGNTVANAALIAITLWSALSLGWPLAGTLASLGGVLILILFGGEVIPKTLALREPERWSRRIATPMIVLVQILRPLHRVGQGLNKAILGRLIPQSVAPPAALTDAEYRELMDMAYQSGTIDESEREIILQIIRLDQRTAKDVMRPRSTMICLPDDLSREEMLAAARRHRHQRLPLYDGTLDTIVGVLNTRVLLLTPDCDLADAIEFPSFVPESMNLLHLLRSLQRQQRGLAIVLDEYGGTAGLVTLEDILAELIGPLRADDEKPGFVVSALGPGRWRVNAAMRIDDFRREYPGLGEVPDVETLGGLVAQVAEVIPLPGDEVLFRGLKFTVTAGDERRVRELTVEVAGTKRGTAP
jgi:putative hemolysin